MELLQKGSQGTAVKNLQLLLRELDYDVPVTSVFDNVTYAAVRNFQGSHLDKHGMPLKVDGKVGDITWWALSNPRTAVSHGVIDFTKMPDAAMGGSTMGRAALMAAIGELKAGAGEIGGNNRGKWVKKYLDPTGLKEGNAWCAAFLSWCFLQAAGGDKSKMPFRYTAGARDLFNQLKNKGLAIKDSGPAYVPQPGDIVAWWRVSLASGLGHIAIVHHFEDGFLYTIEGNKAANVAGFDYVKTSMDKILGYARV
ncbi:CHAP domain-containing protein [Taibaiella chishuiensis]|uniref:Putative peptidoglycan binding protein n=1 Tax=Taibaiella chishuiensis TaxID=1434707 RepID=A0A2P8D862_9BACT|nr:CHAP domain-containing protein [Taibaiella chishuiensis]PSK93420.1 putative peptidoglycan binding protein [Taibaiella chishuiensis]